MNILFVSDLFPYPSTSGGKLRTYNIIKQFKNLNGNIDLVCLSENTPSTSDIDHLKKYVNNICSIDITKKSPLLRLMNIAIQKSDKEFLCYSTRMQNHINKLLKANSYDLIFSESLWMYQYLSNNKLIDKNKIKIILDAHNVEHEILYRMMVNSKGLLVKLYSYIEYKKIKKLENKYSKEADLLFTVSERDKKVYSQIYQLEDHKVEVIDNGIDIEIADQYKNKAVMNEEFILFVGSLWYRPNYEGISWFIEKVWPSIKEKNPDIKLKVIGKYEKELYKGEVDIQFLGFIDDIYAYYKNCAAFIVPLNIGSGTRLKILEAMSFGVPIVSTSIGCEGIHVTDKKNILICDDPQDFSQEVNNVMSNQYPNLGQEGYNLVKSKYDWNIIGKKLRTILGKIVSIDE